jgi:oxygen-dependent protoporphyrinogen oxidase
VDAPSTPPSPAPAATAANRDAAGAPSDSSVSLDLAILGGGISGLALAAWAVQKGLNVAVFDQSDQPGGLMQSSRDEGFLFERGPNTVLDRDPSLEQLIEWAGLTSRTLKVPMKGMARYIWHDGRLNKVPSSPLGALTTPLFSLRGKLRMLREPWIPPVLEDEPLRDFAIRRLGREVYERALVPMVGGVSGGDPADMSTEYSFPVLKELERKGGSLFRGMLARRKENGNAPRRPLHMISFPEGLGELPSALARKLGAAWRPGESVTRLQPALGGSGYKIETSVGTLCAAQVALCSDAETVAGWLDPLAPETSGRLRNVHYCPLIVVGLGIEASSVSLPSGFGFLTTANSELRILGTIFNSTFFERRAPEGTRLLTVMLGGDRDPQALELSDEALMEQVRNDLARAVGWNGRQITSHIVRWARAIPQYGLDHARLVEALDRTERQIPGLYAFGNWRGSAAVGERIRLARELAERISRKKAEKSVGLL